MKITRVHFVLALLAAAWAVNSYAGSQSEEDELARQKNTSSYLLPMSI